MTLTPDLEQRIQSFIDTGRFQTADEVTNYALDLLASERIEQNRALITNWFTEVWNKAQPDAIDRFFAPDGRCYGFPNPDSVVTRDEYKAIRGQFISTFSNINVEIDDVLAETDRVAIRWVAHMTHTGDALGFAATGKSVAMSGSSFCIFRDGVITHGWNFMDFTRVLAQLQTV